MRRPRVDDLPPRLRDAAIEAARRVERAGARAWIVGGAVRDLALLRVPIEVDLTSAATPDELEKAFEHVVPVGRAFGTLLVRAKGVELEHTTFRSDHGYSDARRPDRVQFGRTLEEDAARRDFTCNALYLDPLTDQFVDPTGGIADLERAILRTVGDPNGRFREDGLRLVRMARFCGALELQVDPATLAAARESADSLGGVSVERLLLELERMFARPGGARAIEILRQAGLLDRVLPGRDAGDAASDELRIRALGELEPAPGVALALAALLDPDPYGFAGDLERAAGRLTALRPSRASAREVETLWRLRRELEALVLRDASRADRILLVRAAAWRGAWRLASAFRAGRGVPTTPLDELELVRASLAPEDLRPARLLAPAELEEVGVARGPRIGEFLRALEIEQLDQRVTTREQALAFVLERL